MAVRAVIAKQQAPAGLVLLQSMAGWWDGLSYSGTGNWLNKGTVGATGNLALGPTTAAPTFSVDHFSFDGVNDYMSMVGGNISNFDAPNKGTAWVCGFIVSYPSATDTNVGLTVGKRVDSTHAGWNVQANGTQINRSLTIRDSSSNSAGAISSGLSQTTKLLVTCGCTTTQAFMKLNNAAATLSADGRVSSSSNAATLQVGGNITGSLFTHMDLTALFFDPAKSLSAQDITDIGAYYGLTI